MRKLMAGIVVMCAGILLLATGCATLQLARMTPLERAKVGALLVSSTVRDVYMQVNALNDVATGADKEFLQKRVNPIVNQLKKLCVTYIDMVALWEAAGKKPADIDNVKLQIDQLVLSLVKLGVLKE